MLAKKALLFLILPTLIALPAAAEPIFKIHVEKAGIYRVTFADLVAAGLDKRRLPLANLGLTNAGSPVPIWVEGDGDGKLEKGEWIEFVGSELAGEVSHYNEHSRFNVYLLRLDRESPARLTAHSTRPVGSTEGSEPRPLRRQRHFEEDKVMLRLSPRRDGKSDELWYWQKLAHNRKRPLVLNLELEDIDRHSGGPVVMSLELRGWSVPANKPSPETADHQVVVSLNGEEIATSSWSGTDPHRIEIEPLAADAFIAGENRVGLSIPTRPSSSDGEALIDVAMLNWIKLEYPHIAELGLEPLRIRLSGDPSPQPIRLTTSDGSRPLAVGERGVRIAPEQMISKASPEGGTTWLFHPPDGESTLMLATDDRLLTPAAVVLDRPSQLQAASNRADYIMVVHPRLAGAIAPLAEHHRARGLEVTVVDIEDVYDEFNHGIVHPRALRDFLAHAYHRWQPPAPRFVLLVGDASWDGRNAAVVDANYADWTYRPRESRSFVKNVSTPYAENPSANHRGLIPTWKHSTSQGHSASDNYFVAIDGDDFLPDLAIGRFPVVEPHEVEQIVAKTIRYAEAPVGPWRRRVLFLANEQKVYQRGSDAIAKSLSEKGYASVKIYPAPDEPSNEEHTARLIDALDEGQLMVHFLGHGGRYIWRTGPPDYRKNHDLFTLDHLDQLQPNERLPVVLSLTCYSAPFDHPNADSIGEKLLRIDGRGAVAVLAASWRNSPTRRWGAALTAELAKPGTTIGEAIVNAKRTIRQRIFVETYNLLGDPALPVATPGGHLELSAEHDGGDGLRVQGTLPIADLDGRVIVDLVDADGEPLETVERPVSGADFELRLATTAEKLDAASGLRAYVWDAARGFDAAGDLSFSGTADEAARDGTARAGGTAGSR